MTQTPDRNLLALEAVTAVILNWERRREFLNMNPEVRSVFYKNSAAEIEAALSAPVPKQVIATLEIARYCGNKLVEDGAEKALALLEQHARGG